MSSKKELPISWVNKFGDRIDESDKFEYELTSYLFIPSEGRYELKKSKFITSEREIQSQIKVEYIPLNKKKPKYIIIKTLEMVSAPKWYINFDPLPVFTYIWNKKTKKVKKS